MKSIFFSIFMLVSCLSFGQKFYAYGNLSSRTVGAGLSRNITITLFNGGYKPYPDANYEVGDITTGMVVWINCTRFPITAIVSTSPLVLTVADSMGTGGLDGLDLYGYRLAILEESRVGAYNIAAFPDIADGNAGTQAGLSPKDGACIQNYYGVQLDSAVTLGAGVTDGDKGDVDVSASGATWTVDTSAITTIKIGNGQITLAKIDTLTANRVLVTNVSGRPVEGTLDGILGLSGGVLSAFETDGSVTNEGALSVGTAGATTSQIATNTSGDGGVILKAAGINALTESADTITITATEVDGSVSNELDNLDAAYNNFGAASSKITVDAAQSQTGGLEIELSATNNPNLVLDMQGTGDINIQDAGSTVHTFSDTKEIGFNKAIVSGEMLGVQSTGTTSATYPFRAYNSSHDIFSIRSDGLVWMGRVSTGWRWNTQSADANDVTNGRQILFAGVGDPGATSTFHYRVLAGTDTRTSGNFSFINFGNSAFAPSSGSHTAKGFLNTGSFSSSGSYSGIYAQNNVNTVILNTATGIYKNTILDWSITGGSSLSNDIPITILAFETPAGTTTPTSYKGITQDNANFKNGFGNVTSPSETVHVGGGLRLTADFKDSNNQAGTAGQVLSSTGTATDWVDISSISVQNWQTISSTGSITVNTSSVTIPVKASSASGAVDVTLGAASNDKVIYKIVATDVTNTLRLLPASGLINGASSYTFTTQYQSVEVISDGTNYYIF
jgi:hypothetical protein